MDQDQHSIIFYQLVIRINFIISKIKNKIIVHSWVYVWSAIDYNKKGYNLQIFTEGEAEPFIDSMNFCPDNGLLTNCLGGVVDRPFIYRDGVLLWVGSRGAYKPGNVGYTLCGKVAAFQLYPELFTLVP